MSRILIVEDEAHLAQGLRFNLEAEGHEAHVIGDGAEARTHLLATPGRYDLVVLDVMLPGANGFEVVGEWRRAGEFVPVLILTARSRPEDVLLGFEAGADDYLPKPFELTILMARVKGLLRRRRWNEQDAPAAQDTQPDTYRFAGRTLDFGAMEVRSHGRSYRLTQMECDLLRYLVRNAGQAVSRRAILENVWGVHEEADTRPIDNFVVRLRRYLEDRPSSPQFLQTVRGVGYRFVPDSAAGPPRER